MQENNMIEVNNLKKRFKVYYDKGSSLKEKLLFFKRNRYENRWVLNGISFQVKKGEAIGLIGKNGCGKSTTLKLLTRIMYPTAGQVKVHGRVSSLIELGAGFHPDMSGRENIYTNASIFGLTKKQINKRIDDIIAFSELEEFIDNPVRTYSSGMYMRLAFSVAINVEADVLLIDEILAVGDVSFQKKCFERLKQIKRSGTTIVIVSHALGQIEEICDRSIWIEDGRIKMEDKPDVVHKKYLAKMEKERLARAESEYEQTEGHLADKPEEINYFCGRKVLRKGKGQIFITNIQLSNDENKPCAVFRTEEKMNISIQYENKTDKKQAVFCMRIYAENNNLCFGTNTDIECGEMLPIEQMGKLTITIDRLALLEGQYIIDIDILDDNHIPQDVLHEAAYFHIENTTGRKGTVMMNTAWKAEESK